MDDREGKRGYLILEELQVVDILQRFDPRQIGHHLRILKMERVLVLDQSLLLQKNISTQNVRKTDKRIGYE